MAYQLLYVMKQGTAPSPLFKSHWALLVLIGGDVAEGNAIGTYIHVTGNAFQGFTFEVKRNWNQARTAQSFRPILIGQVPETSVTLWPPITTYMIDFSARSPLEMALLTEPAPGKSLRSTGRTSSRTEPKDCQWWIRQALPHAAVQGHVQLFQGADQVLDISNQ